MTKFFVGSGWLPLKMSTARPAIKAAKRAPFMPQEYSSPRNNSLRARRRRNFPEARPRRTSSLRLKKSIILAPGGRSMLLIGINNGTDQGVTHDIPIGKITHGDAGHGL